MGRSGDLGRLGSLLHLGSTSAPFRAAIWVPRHMPPEVIAKLNAEIIERSQIRVQRPFHDRGQEVWPKEGQNPAALAAKQKEEIERWAPIVKEAGIKVQ